MDNARAIFACATAVRRIAWLPQPVGAPHPPGPPLPAAHLRSTQRLSSDCGADRICEMKRTSAMLLVGATVLAVHASASDGIPLSPSDMTAALERKIVSGVGVMYPGSDLESATTPALVLLDAEWPDAFLDRIGKTISVRVSSTTGYYEFTDESGSVFWIEVPVTPLTWNWVAPFQRPFASPFDDLSLLAPWHLADRWRLSTEALEELRAVPPLLRSLPLRSTAGTNDVTNLCFTAFTFTETNLYFTAAWPTNNALPGNVLDLYCSTSHGTFAALNDISSTTSSTTGMSVNHFGKSRTWEQIWMHIEIP